MCMQQNSLKAEIMPEEQFGKGTSIRRILAESVTVVSAWITGWRDLMSGECFC